MRPFVFSSTDLAGLVVERHLTVQAAAASSGYSPQYLRRLLRKKRLRGLKLGQQWLIDLESFTIYLAESEAAADRRYGPQRPAGEVAS